MWLVLSSRLVSRGNGCIGIALCAVIIAALTGCGGHHRVNICSTLFDEVTLLGSPAGAQKVVAPNRFSCADPSVPNSHLVGITYRWADKRDRPSQVLDFYLRELKSGGWSYFRVDNLAPPGSTSRFPMLIAGKTRENDRLTLYVRGLLSVQDGRFMVTVASNPR